MIKRNFRTSEKVLDNIGFYEDLPFYYKNKDNILIRESNNERCLLQYWHNDRYLYQNLAYFQEKYDCQGITELEWNKIKEYFTNKIEKLEKLS